MKKINKLFLFILLLCILSFKGVKAADVLYTCTYKADDYYEQKKVTLKYEILSDKTVNLPFKSKKSYDDSGFAWINNNGDATFKKDFYKKAEEKGDCPTMTVMYFQTSVEIHLGTKTNDECTSLNAICKKINGTKEIKEAGKNQNVNTTVTTTSCPKTINFKVNGTSHAVKLNFWMLSNGQKYWSVNKQEAKAGESIYAEMFSGYYATYSITNEEINKIFKQTDNQKKENKFTCPSNLYLNEDNTYNYFITTNKDEENSSYGNIINTPTTTNNNTNNNVNNNTSNNSTSGMYVQCGGITGIPSGLPAFSRNIVNLIKFAIPIILCILGMIDFAKAVMAGDEKAMSEGPKKFIKRVIAAVLVFFVVSIVQFIFNILGNSDPDQEYINNENFNSCLKCFISDESGCSEDTSTN